MTVFALIACIVLSTSSLAWGFSRAGLSQLSGWILASARCGSWPHGAAGVGSRTWASPSISWLRRWVSGSSISGPHGCLRGPCLPPRLGPDLVSGPAHFCRTDDERRKVELRHLLRIAVLGILGIVFSSLAMVLQLRFSFDWIVFMAIVLALGISQIIRWFRSRT